MPRERGMPLLDCGEWEPRPSAIEPAGDCMPAMAGIGLQARRDTRIGVPCDLDQWELN